jgi:serine-type D-Ala-D-Ala carboxypeptidase (penicillin-binding protein 5/6)
VLRANHEMVVRFFRIAGNTTCGSRGKSFKVSRTDNRDMLDAGDADVLLDRVAPQNYYTTDEVPAMVQMSVDEGVNNPGMSFDRFVIRLAALALPAIVTFSLVASGAAQTQPARGETQSQKIARKAITQQPEVPAPEVVNAEVARKQPADRLDGPPFVTARTWAIADGRTGAILWGHDEAKPVDIASTTKIMTAYVVLRLAASEPAVLDEMVTFSKRADGTIGSSSEVEEGEQLPVRELLYGLLLPSGNDAAVAFAEHFGGRMKTAADEHSSSDPLPRFIAEMNRTAAELGLRETHFVNPNGLPAPGHQSSARDLAKLTQHALELPTFARYVSTVKHGATLQGPSGRKRNVLWTNTNRLLDTEGYDGVKTGTTRAAGECLVASGRRNGDHVIVVILGASSTEARYADARNLFRYAWLMRGQRPD